ncbi:hypothetical protein OF83DRAFT_1175807 [Amylostereum chailletii]|nr:hypothetical protein OF83DRAFT_1175807 [Amylostereum chailletii]
MAIIEEVNNIKESERPEMLTHDISNAFGGIKVALHFLHPVVSTKPIFESPPTTLLINSGGARSVSTTVHGLSSGAPCMRPV